MLTWMGSVARCRAWDCCGSDFCSRCSRQERRGLPPLEAPPLVPSRISGRFGGGTLPGLLHSGHTGAPAQGRRSKVYEAFEE